MSDVPETPDGSVEAEQSTAERVPTPDLPDGWTGEWEPHRAKATIDRLREFEPDAQTLRKLRQDPQEFARFAAELGYELDEPDPDPGFEEPAEDPYAEKIAELEQWKQQQELERTSQQITGHISELAEKAGLELSDRESRYVFQQAVAEGVGPQFTERAFQDFKDFLEARDQVAVENYRKSKRAPASPPAGKPGEAQFDQKDPKARQAAMAARIAAGE